MFDFQNFVKVHLNTNPGGGKVKYTLRISETLLTPLWIQPGMPILTYPLRFEI